MLQMLKNVSNNPQIMNVLASLTGQNTETLQQALQSLQPANSTVAAEAAAAVQPSPAAPTISEVVNAPTVSRMAMPNPNDRGARPSSSRHQPLLGFIAE